MFRTLVRLLDQFTDNVMYILIQPDRIHNDKHRHIHTHTHTYQETHF